MRPNLECARQLHARPIESKKKHYFDIGLRSLEAPRWRRSINVTINTGPGPEETELGYYGRRRG